MGAVVVVDAGVVIGYLDANDVHHRASVLALESHTAADLRLPASAYAEALAGPIRRGRVERARSEIRALDVRIDAIDEAGAEEAATLRARRPALRLPDALVLGHAEAIGADVVLTTDRRWRRVSKRVEVV